MGAGGIEPLAVHHTIKASGLQPDVRNGPRDGPGESRTHRTPPPQDGGFASLPTGPYGRGRIRTDTNQCLKLVPLPVGLRVQTGQPGFEPGITLLESVVIPFHY